MMTSELRYLLKINSDNEACSDQASLRELLDDLQTVAGDLELDFGRALVEVGTVQEARDLLAFDPCI